MKFTKENFYKKDNNFKIEKMNIFDKNLTEENFRSFFNLKENSNLFSEINLHISIYDENNYNNTNNNFEKIEKRKESVKNFISELNKKFDLNFIFIYEHYFFWFKDFFHKILETENILINGQNYINKIWKYYIAIITVSSGKSEYLLKILEERFLVSGGDKNWLIYGLEIVPKKLKKLAKLVNIISHQPWKIMEDGLKVKKFLNFFKIFYLEFDY